MQQLQFLTEQGIVIHAQIVLARELNLMAGDWKTIQDLAALWPRSSPWL